MTSLRTCLGLKAPGTRCVLGTRPAFSALSRRGVSRGPLAARAEGGNGNGIGPADADDAGSTGFDFNPERIDTEALVANIQADMESGEVQTSGSSGAFAQGLLGDGLAANARFSDDIIQALMDLPGTEGVMDLRIRADALAQFQTALNKGRLPDPKGLQWPVEPFRSTFMSALAKLEMPRFTRRYPQLLNSLLKQMLALAHQFEEELAEKMENQDPNTQAPPKDPQQSPPTSSPSAGSGDADNEEGEDNQGEEGETPPPDMQQGGDDESDGQEGQEGEQQDGEGTDGEQQYDINMEMDFTEGDAGGEGGEMDDQMKQMAEEIAEDLVKQFEEQMAPVMEGLEEAAQAFGDLDDLLEGPEGFDLSRSTWQKTGWTEFKELRTKLEQLRELRDLVRALGRGGGKGPLRRAPQEVYNSKSLEGTIRDPIQPEEVTGLCRSGDLSRMLPSEAAFLAHGWPRQDSDDEDEDGTKKDPAEKPGSRAARLLHMARRAERNLLSYERTGWVEDQPARVTGRMEIRPAAELGPIIVCLDTSGSMRGARELVAKALVLECMRGAHRQQRACYVYAFSGPGEVQSMELGVDMASLDRLLEFLACSFNGGTDADAPLELSLQRLEQDDWAQADILMVTDGEIKPPTENILNKIERFHDEMGLEVHGLIVSSRTTDAIRALCTHIHTFKSWNVVGAESWQY